MTEEQKAAVCDLACMVDEMAGLAACMASHLEDRSNVIGSAPTNALHALVRLAEGASAKARSI